MFTSMFLGQFGVWQVVLVVAVLLLLFGGKKIPELMKGIGRGVKEFKDGVKGPDDDNNNSKSIQE